MSRKKILFVTNHFRFSNGVASVLRSMIENLDQIRFEVHLLVLYEFDPEFAKPVEGKATIHKGFGFYFHGFDKIVNLIPLKLLYKLFVRNKYDLEIAYQFGLPTRMIALSPNPNKICWMHGYDRKMRLRKFYPKFQQIITVAKVGNEKLVKDGFSAGMCSYAYNIIDEDIILKQASEPLELKKTHKYCVITVGRQSAEKAGLRQLECIKAVHELISNVEFWIIGDGAEYPKMKVYHDVNDMKSYVKLLGSQKNPYKYMKAADLYFCGSTSEGFSTACQEAALLGLPVLSTDVDGAKELIETSRAGKVIPNTPEAIKNSMLKIFLNIELICNWIKLAKENKRLFYKSVRIKRITELLLKYGE